MHGRWRFRLVRPNNLEAVYLRSGGGRPVELFGGDQEALLVAGALWREGILRVEAVSVGCPAAITPTRGRKLVTVRVADDGRGWVTESFKPTAWHERLVDAVAHAASKTTGQVAEIRILDAKDRTTHVVLIPSRAC
jgi:hypothetical protein